MIDDCCLGFVGFWWLWREWRPCCSKTKTHNDGLMKGGDFSNFMQIIIKWEELGQFSYNNNIKLMKTISNIFLSIVNDVVRKEERLFSLTFV